MKYPVIVFDGLGDRKDLGMASTWDEARRLVSRSGYRFMASVEGNGQLRWWNDKGEKIPAYWHWVVY